MKKCTLCKIKKDFSEFHINNAHPTGRTPRCKSCRKITEIGYKYGLSARDYLAMLERAEGTCEICYEWNEHLVVDHDHDTDLNRGILCDSCNIGLGHFHDSVTRLQSAIIYLKRED